MTRRHDAPAFYKEGELDVRFPGKHTFLGQDIPLFAALGDAYDAGVAVLDHLFQHLLDLIAGHCASHVRSSP